MNFLQVWMSAYLQPSRAIEALKEKRKPEWGFYGYVIRGVGTSIFYYVPSILLGRQPGVPSYLVFWPTETYYYVLAFAFPVVSLGIWLLCGALTHVALRFLGRPSEIDHILNINGISWLVLGPVILSFDWFLILAFWEVDVYLWGLSHLLLDLWYLYLIAVGYKKILGLPYWLSVCLFMLQMAASVPIAILLLRD